ncbi:TRM11 family SAM-dependent methyltransferase [Virgisporangium aurantiacum]|uniref:TRM11 family SAM-dependent methyltransferase n=1 Tax=Virgisporangium aurantiacum TaxID=175570 RepID=UPI00194E3231|nr:DNA methyltransferase [Virgisporangium aurantiacum]
MYTSTTPLQAAISGIGQSHVGPAATVWPTGQDNGASQRAGRYLPQTQCHPQRTRPALAATAIERYSRPGQTVFDPFVGSGTTVVEAVHVGRRAIGVDIDPRWVELTERNLHHARQHGATGAAMILRGDARHLQPVPRRLRGTVDLVLTTPPARLNASGHSGRRWSNADLVGQMETDLKLSFACWIPLLRSGTTIVLTSRLLHRGHQMLDLTVPIAYAAEWAGLALVERIAALHVPISDTRRARRPITRNRRRLSRPRVIHDDVLVYRVPDVLPTWWRGRR